MENSNSGDGLTWEQPPPPASDHRTKWSLVAEQLRARPGEWAIVAVRKDTGLAASMANNLRKGRYGGVTEGEFESASRKIGDECRVYLRYIGQSEVQS